MKNDIPTIAETAALSHRLTETVCTVIRGAGDTCRLLTSALLCGGHVLLEDLPGTGKTTLVRAYAKALGCGCRRIQCTPDLMPADLTGFEMLAERPDGSREMIFRKGPVFTNLLLADEINRMAPRSQAGLLECMAEKQVTSGNETYALPEPFFVIATQNPIELQGTFPLPEAQLDRFLMRLQLGIPPREDALCALRDRSTADPLDAVQPVTTPEELCAAQRAVRRVKASDGVLGYLLDLAENSRKHPQVRWGLGMRGVLMLRNAAQAFAAAEERDYLIPDDIKAVFPPVAAHRLCITGAMPGDAQAAGRIAAELLTQTPVPKA